MALDELQRKPVGEDRSHLAEAHADVKEGKIARVFKSEFPVNYRTSTKMRFKFPGNFVQLV